MANSKNRFKSETEIEAIVRGFENCTLPDSEFKHAEHLTVALYYLHRARLTVPEATEKMRDGLYRFLDHHAGDRQAYNETITLFWIRIVDSFLSGTDTARPVEAIANELIEAFGNSNLLYEYFSRERVLSKEARTTWVEPDLKPLNF
ncbi:MAG TPA: hypothetical protein VM095_08195 [Pyrinomonadaceae bacterium]|nr:hypothetical protein [Pyrinomonadaceae bacterium]